jgi:hypothetical protein
MNWRLKLHQHKRDLLIGLLIFEVGFAVFLCSPVRQFSDSKYAFVVSESLLKHGTFAIDQFGVPRFEPRYNGRYMENGRINELEWVGNRLYYYLPPGTSVLSLPYVALMDVFGLSVINKDGTYNVGKEIQLQLIFSAFLMALLGSIFYFTGRLVLPALWSVFIALGGTLATQVWSTLSGSMWSDTWGIFLLGLVVWMLLAEASAGIRLRPILVATLLAWTYFVRPTNAIPILAISVYMLLYHRRLFARYAVTGLIWLALFVSYSWYNFGKMLPDYYRTSRLAFEHFGEALAGNLVSPARGLFIYVPVTLFIFYLLARYRRKIVWPRLVVLSSSIFAVHWIVTSGFSPWFGGGSYGPRLMSGVLPWLVLLSIIAVQALLKAREQGNNRPLGFWRLQNVVGGTLLLVSVCMNGIGATMPAVLRWNNKPVRIDRDPSRLWDWRHPQFLAGFLLPPPPKVFPPTDVRIDFSRKSADPYLWYGWTEHGGERRWSEGDEATIVFSLDSIADAHLLMRLAPFIVGGKPNEQRISMKLNGQLLENLTLKDPSPREYSRILPKELLQRNNILTFELPDARSPKELNLNDDERKLALGVYWLEIKTQGQSGVQDAPKYTEATAPLPDAGYAVEFQAMNAPRTLTAGESLDLRVTVKNISGVIWPARGDSSGKYQIRLGNHWVDSNGRTAILNDGRTALPHDLSPGGSVDLMLRITAPQTPGEYTLELDMVQEHVTWFADQDSPTMRVKITVR